MQFNLNYHFWKYIYMYNIDLSIYNYIIYI